MAGTPSMLSCGSHVFFEGRQYRDTTALEGRLVETVESGDVHIFSSGAGSNFSLRSCIVQSTQVLGLEGCQLVDLCDIFHTHTQEGLATRVTCFLTLTNRTTMDAKCYIFTHGVVSRLA